MTALEQNIQNYFGVMQPEQLQCISNFFIEETLDKNSVYLEEANHCNTLSFIKSGYIRIYRIANGKEVTQWIAQPGYFVTDLYSLLFNSTARFTMQALTTVELYTISKINYTKIGQVVPQWHQLEKMFIAKCFVFLEDRIFSHLSMPAEERYQLFYKDNKELFNQVPLQYIASMLGMTPETLSRLRKHP